jgi:hypothetical protein
MTLITHTPTPVVGDDDVEIETAAFLRRHGHDFYRTESSVRLMAAIAVRELLEARARHEQASRARAEETKANSKAETEVREKLCAELVAAKDELAVANNALAELRVKIGELKAQLDVSEAD